MVTHNLYIYIIYICGACCTLTSPSILAKTPETTFIVQHDHHSGIGKKHSLLNNMITGWSANLFQKTHWHHTCSTIFTPTYVFDKMVPGSISFRLWLFHFYMIVQHKVHTKKKANLFFPPTTTMPFPPASNDAIGRDTFSL